MSNEAIASDMGARIYTKNNHTVKIAKLSRKKSSFHTSLELQHIFRTRSLSKVSSFFKAEFCNALELVYTKIATLYMIFRTMFKKIIVRLPNWIGDVVMATPVLTDLRGHFPDAMITAMCQSPISDLLKHDVAIDELLCFRPHEAPIDKLRDGKYDLGILLPHSFSSAAWFWRGSVKHRLGFSGQWRSLLLTDRIKRPNGAMHQVEYYKHLLVPLDIPISHTAPRLYLTESEKIGAKKLLLSKGYREGCSIIGINPGAAYGTAKCWPADRFRELALRLLQQDKTAFVVFFGDKASFDLADGDRIIHLVGATTLRELACLIQLCDVLITNDSGPMHIGAALNTPLVALFGSTDETRTGPWGQKDAVMSIHASCSPCFKRTCPCDFRCMKQIGVEEVMKKTFDRRQKSV